MDPGPCGASRGAPRGASGGVPGGAPRGAPGGVPRGVPGGVLGGVPRGVPGGVPGGAVPGGLSGLESSLPHSDPPCLIVEDSQPDSTGIEDDPESSYRALLTRRLSALQPRAASPVLELISSPVGSRSSQSSSQSQPPICEMNPSFEESEVLEVSEKNRGRSDQMNSRAGSQSVGGKGLTPLPVAEGASQFGLLELSQSQDFGSEPDQNQTRTGESFESQSSRPGPQVCVQALLHSQVLDQDPDQDREEMMSSQQDLFDKPGPADATRLSSTPSHSLALLQLSGSVQGTLVHNSLSQASEDFVAPTPDPFSPALVPSSPTDLTPQGGVRPGPASSTPVSQNTPGFEPERPLSVPSQPDFSHDVFVATPRSSPPHHAPDEDEEATQIEPDLSTPSQNCPPEPGPESSPSAADQAEKLNVPGSQKSQEAKNQPETPKPRQEHDPRGQERDPRGLNNGKSATSFIQSDAKANSQPAGSVPESAAGSQTKVLNVDHEKTARTVTQGGAKSNSQPAGSSVRESNHEKISLSQNGAKANSQPAVTPLTLNVPQAKIKSAGHDKVSQGSDPSHPGGAAEGAELNAGAAEGAELNAGAAEGAELNAGAAETQREATLGLALSQNLTPEVTEAGGKMAGGRKEKREASGAKSLDSSGDMSFHFTLPKEGELIGPSVGATPPHLSQLKQSLRHSTPIEVNSLSQNSDVSAGSDITAEGSDVATEGADGKLSLRMKLVTPVEEGSSERFSLQRPSLADDASSRPTKSPHSASVFSRVRQVHRAAPEDSATLRSPLFASPQRNSLQNNSLPNSQSDASMQELTSSAANESRGKSLSQNAPGAANSLDKTDPETPPPRRAGPAHRRQVRTIQEVRTTVTRIITDVYYEDGKEVDRTVTQECDEPVVQFQVLDVSPSRTGSSSLTSGDLADISSSICTTGTTSSSTTGPSDRPAFLIPSTRGGKSGRAPPAGSAQDPSSQVQVSDSAASSPDPQSSSSFVGLRVVAKWSSNGYFYSGRIIQDFGVQGGPASSGSGSSPGSGPGENRFRLRFDDGYECELWARDILLCDPIPLETEVTALNQDQTYCTGVVKAHKLEDLELQYCVERGEHRVWFPRSSVILSLDQGNRLRERHSLGPYQHCSVGTASDISLDNLVEGKRKRRGAQSGLNPSSRSPRGPRPKPSPGPSPGPNPGSKRKSSSERPPAAKRGRRGAVQQVSALNTSDSDPSPVSCDHAPGACDVSCDLVTTHGPLPQNTALFEGFVFLLTSSSERDRLSNRREDEDLVQTGPYSKRYTESQLQSGGGIILKEFNHQQCEAAYQSLLIADQHCCNGTYLLCVVSAVPCVSHLWVRDCCRENQLQNYRNYLLPAGAGPGGGVREWRGPRSFPFKSLRILICVKDRIQFWSELVQLGGGTALIQQDHTDLSSLSADVLVLGPGPDPVPGLHLPRVSVDWIIDSVVCGETLDFSGSWFGLDSSSSSS